MCIRERGTIKFRSLARGSVPMCIYIYVCQYKYIYVYMYIYFEVYMRRYVISIRGTLGEALNIRGKDSGCLSGKLNVYGASLARRQEKTTLL